MSYCLSSHLVGWGGYLYKFLNICLQKMKTHPPMSYQLVPVIIYYCVIDIILNLHSFFFQVPFFFLQPESCLHATACLFIYLPIYLFSFQVK